jgi:hypothetical protein
MITRRIFTAFGVAFATVAACGPSWGTRVFALDDGRISPRLHALGDAWEIAARAYEAQKFATFHEGVPKGGTRAYMTEAPELVAWRASYRRLLAAGNDLFVEPSQTRADVILKYHIMDDLSSWRHVPDDNALIETGGVAWHRIVEREAEAFGLKLNFFWLWEAGPYAEIDGDRNSPAWAAVARWRTERYAAPV